MSTIQTIEHYFKNVRTPDIPHSQSWQPVIFKLKPSEVNHFYEFSNNYNINIVDTIDQQISDYANVKIPAGSKQAQRKKFIKELHEKNGVLESYGNWVYLPWLTKVVHLLERNDYFDVITNRNQFKITHSEQLKLRNKKVGIIGLSVGAEAAVTIAQEHLCGEIVIADFDNLELSNLNRINARFDEIGNPKTLITARRIIGINPYLSISIFEEGITDNNTDKFLDGLDLLVEECDDLSLKFKLRKAAKSQKLNIVFAADERGMLSIEPYQHSTKLNEFHGFITNEPLSKNNYSTTNEFFRELTKWLGGWDHISERSRKSVESIGITLCGYPQLAGEARLAAGQISHIARQLLLGKKLQPYFGYFDIDEIISIQKQ